MHFGGVIYGSVYFWVVFKLKLNGFIFGRLGWVWLYVE